MKSEGTSDLGPILKKSPTDRLRVLFVDDEKAVREIMKIEVPKMGHDVTICEDGSDAIRTLEKQFFDAAIVDLRMPGLSGWDVIEHIKKASPDTEVVIQAGHGGLDDAIRALRLGAYDFLPKPCKLFEINSVLRRIADKRTLTNKTIALETRLKAVEGSPDLIGSTPSMLRVKKLIEKIAPSDSSVLILGETGTGKELVARRIHDLSQRAHQPFVAVNCGALPENLVESELFGHRKGAFTGADTPRKGLLEVANGGTLFLDELGELDKAMQVKMLRFLESGEVRRVGENEAFHVDVRIICATNRDLAQMVQEGTFREDLFFRVNTFEVHLPALRERKDDLAELSQTLIARHLKRRDVPASILAPETLEVLKQREWTGNIRELANALEHATILCGGGIILPEHLPGYPERFPEASVLYPPLEYSIMTTTFASTPTPEGPPKTMREIELDAIQKAIDRNNGNKIKAAAELEISLTTVYSKLKSEVAPKAKRKKQSGKL